MSKTKTVALSQDFLRAAAGDEEAALAYMLMSAFGVSLSTCLLAVQKAVATGDSKIIVMMLGAGVQVRGNIVFVGREYANVRTAYPALVIEGDRDQKDIFNYSALHVCGHILAHATTDALGGRVLNKGGDCVLGTVLLDTEAGKINREIYSGWPQSEKDAVSKWADNLPGADQARLDGIIANYSVLSTQFAAKLLPKPPARPATGGTSTGS